MGYYEYTYDNPDKSKTRYVEHMSLNELIIFKKTHLQEPTFITTLYGGLCLFRILPDAYSHYACTHNGIVFNHQQLKLRKHLDANNKLTFDPVGNQILTTFQMHKNGDHYDLAVRLTDTYGTTATHLLKFIVASLFVKNPYSHLKISEKVIVDHIDHNEQNVHFQNLYYRIK